MVLFFGLVFSVGSPGDFSADALGRRVPYPFSYAHCPNSLIFIAIIRDSDYAFFSVI